MKKVLLSLAIVSIVSLSAKAQKSDSKSESGFTLDVGVNPALPLGNLSDISTFGIGGFVKGAVPLADNIDGTLTATYISFLGKTVTETDPITGTSESAKEPASNIFTVLAGASYKMDGGMHIDAGVGYGSLSESVDLGNGTSVSASSGGFAYRAGLGYKLESGFDITANYNGISLSGGSASWIGVGIAYTFVK